MIIMKAVIIALHVLSFALQYCVPVAIFGQVIPYTHDDIKAGLTKMGYFALVFLVIIASKKIKKRLMETATHVQESVIDSVTLLAVWCVIQIGLNLILGFIANLAAYWMRILLFLILGRLVAVCAAYLESEQKDIKEQNNE